MIQTLFGTQDGDLANNYVGSLYGGLTHGSNLENRVPWIVPGTFRSMVFKNDPNGTWTLYKNDVATALTCNGNGSDQSNTVTITSGDVASGPVWLHYGRTGSAKPAYVDNPVSSCVEFESSDNDPRTSAYANSTMQWASNAGNIAGGIFGGGQQQWSGTSASPNIKSNFYHVASLVGEITSFGTLVAFKFTTNPVKGVTLALALNGVVQNGSGGTPDTRLTTLGTAALETFTGGLSSGWSVPVAVGDRVEVYKTNVGDLNAEGIYQIVSAAITFRVATGSEHRYMVCGATQSYIVSSTPLYASHPGRLESLEDDPGPGGSPYTPIGTINIAPVRNTTIIGLLSHATRPGGGNVNTLEFQLRKNEATPTTAPILLTTQSSADLVIDTDTTHQVALVLGDVWDTRARSVEGPNISTQYHWTYTLRATVPTSDSSERSPQRGIYVPTRGVGGAEGGGTGANFNALDSRIIQVPVRNRGIYVPTRGIGGAEGGGEPGFDYLTTRHIPVPAGPKRTLYVEPTPRTATVYDGEGYTHR